jgi:serine/threonine protein kinase
MTPPSPAPAPPPAGLGALVHSLKEEWRLGRSPNTAAAVRDHPELLRHRSFVIDLAYEEYCLREEAGVTPDPEAFCRDLPAFRSQVREVIDGHRLLADHPELFDGPEADWPGPGDMTEGLTVIRELGRGAFARAFLALDPEAGDRPVVLKLSHAGTGEGRTLGPIVHPNVVRVNWARHTSGTASLCTPFVGSATLLDAIAAAFGPGVGGRPTARTILDVTRGLSTDPAPEPPPAALLTGRESYPDAVAKVGAELAAALAHIHESGILHGDLKPSNVVLGPGGHPYLIDFNLARKRDGSILRCGGTLPYMAPERLRVLAGDPPAVTEAAPADVFALGVVLFEALTCRVPFPPPDTPNARAAAADLLRRQAAGPPRVRSSNPRVPRPLARLVEACLAVDPARRPAAADVRGELASFAGRHVRQGKRLLTGAAVTALAIVVALISLKSHTDLTPAIATIPPPHPAAPADGPQPASNKEWFDRGLRELRAGESLNATTCFEHAVIPDRDGQSLAYLAYCRAKGGHREVAVNLYREAVDVRKYNEGWARNNWAYYLSFSANPTELGRAINECTAVLNTDPACRAARLNRAWATFQLHRCSHAKDDRPANAEWLADIEAVVASGPETIDVCYKAAAIIATFGRELPDQTDRVFHFLRRTVELGKPARQLTGDPYLRHLNHRPEFQALLALPATKSAGDVNVALMDPPHR